MKNTLHPFACCVLLFTLLFFTTTADAQINFQWVDGFLPVSGVAETKAVTTDNAGNAYVTGYFEGTVDFDPSNATANLVSTAAYYWDIFVAKYDAAGNYTWAFSITADDYSEGSAIALDASGNVLVTGYFNGTADFNPGSGTANLTSNNKDAFFAKYTANGDFVWANDLGPGAWELGHGIASDAFNNVYVTGEFWSTVDFDPGSGTHELTSSGQADCFIGKYDSMGNYIWAISFGQDNGDDIPYSIDVSDAGNIAICGMFQNTVDFDPGTGTANKTSNGLQDIFVAKYTSAGAFVWANTMGGSSNDVAYGVKCDRYENIYVTGYFTGTVDFDPSGNSATETTDGSANIFLAKYSSSGNYIWVTAMGSDYTYDSGSSIDLDQDDNVCLVGTFTGVVDFDPSGNSTTLTAYGSEDAFAAKYYSMGGELMWVIQMGGANDDFGWGISTHNNKVYTTGYVHHSGDFDPTANDAILTGSSDFENGFLSTYEDLSVGIDETTVPSTNISVYPNPATSFIIVPGSPDNSIRRISIYDLEGKVIRDISVQTSLPETINVSELESGYYFLSVQSAVGLTRTKFLKL